MPHSSPIDVVQAGMASPDDISAGEHLYGVFVTILVIGGIVFGGRALGKPAWRRRRAQLAAYAAQRGWAYQPDARPCSRAFTPRPFEYVYIDKNIGYGPGGNGEVARTYFFSVVAVGLGWEIPRTEFIPEGVTQKVAKKLGGDDLDVESDAFNRKWRVKTLDDRAAHALLTPTVIERLLADEFAGVPFFFERGFLVHFVEGPRSEYMVDWMLAVCQNVLDLVPDFVVHDYRRQA